MVSEAVREYIKNLRCNDEKLDLLLRERKQQEAGFQAALGYTYIFDARGHYLFASLLGAKLLGRNPSDLEGKHWREIGLKARTMETLEADLQKVIADGTLLHNCFCTPSPVSAGSKYFEYTLQPMFAAGRVEAVLCTARDITHQMTRRQAEEKITGIFKAIPNPIVITAVADGRVVDVNPAFLGIFGFTRDEVIGHVCSELKLWRCAADRERVVQRFRRDRKLDSFELAFWTKSGQPRNFLVFANQIRLNGEELLIVSLTDITARKTVEDLFTKAFHANPNPMSISRLPEGAFVDVNAAWLRTFGFEKQEVLGRTPGQLNLWVDCGRSRCRHVALDSDNKIRNVEMPIRTKWGQVRILLICEEFVEINGEKHLLAAMTDVTEGKQLENKIARLDRLTLISNMAAGVAHEIRNPLTVIKGYIQYLRRKVGRDTRERFDMVLDELRTVEEIIGDFLSLAKTKVCEQCAQNLNAAIDDVFPLLYADAVSKGMDVQVRFDETLPQIYMDEKEIKQLVLNLARNGIEASDSRGRVTIETACEKEAVVLKVSDTGCGIPADKHQKIFDPFYSTKDNGTGLGLAVCASIVDRHGGAIEVQSAEGAGTTIVVKFPPAQQILCSN